MCRCSRSWLWLLLLLALGRPGGLVRLLDLLLPLGEEVSPQRLSRHTTRPGYVASDVLQTRLALRRSRLWTSSTTTCGSCCL